MVTDDAENKAEAMLDKKNLDARLKSFGAPPNVSQENALLHRLVALREAEQGLKLDGATKKAVAAEKRRVKDALHALHR